VRPDVEAPEEAPPPPPTPRHKPRPERWMPRRKAASGGLAGGVVVLACLVGALVWFKPWAGEKEEGPPPPGGAGAPTVGRTANTDKSRAKVGTGTNSTKGAKVVIFDGKQLSGWTALNDDGTSDVSKHWTVKDGVLHGQGGRSHLFSPRGDYRD